MNPPPYRPPEGNKNPLLRQVLLASLVALPIMAVIVFAAIFAVHAEQKAAQKRAALRDITASANQMQSNLKKNFDPKNGITNVDLTDFNKFRKGVKDASQTFSGDDAIIAKVVADYLDRVQAAATNYQAVALKLREARVLDNFDSSDKGQIAARRELVQQFLEANNALKQTVTGAEKKIRDDLIAGKIQESKVDSYMEKFRASTAPKNALVVKIRQCDDRMANAMLDALNMLETQWGHWKADPSIDKIRFEETTALKAYNNDLVAIKAAGQDQVKLQQILVNQPEAP
jgi:hypothetical protein